MGPMFAAPQLNGQCSATHRHPTNTGKMTTASTRRNGAPPTGYRVGDKVPRIHVKSVETRKRGNRIYTSHVSASPEHATALRPVPRRFTALLVYTRWESKANEWQVIIVLFQVSFAVKL